MQELLAQKGKPCDVLMCGALAVHPGKEARDGGVLRRLEVEHVLQAVVVAEAHGNQRGADPGQLDVLRC